MQELSIPIKGMHCKACTIVIADELSKLPGVQQARASLKTNLATIEFTQKPTQKELEFAIKTAGYSIGADKKHFFSRDKNVYEMFAINLVAIAVILFLLKGLGATSLNLNSLSGSRILMALAVGITAGFSTCMALVGGLVLGLSSRYAEKHPTATTTQRFRPHLFFNLGRILTFFVLGGAIGLFGSVFKLNSSLLGLLTVGVGFVMIILGLQLTELFPKLSNKGITLPASLARIIGIKKHGSKEYSHKNALILGGLSFFLPCGFTQAMQLVAISSGSFITGSLVMGMFAIGTSPGLLGIGGLTSVVKGSFAKSFFRFAGVAVVLLAFYNINNGLTLMGYNFSLKNDQQNTTSINTDSQQVANNTSNSQPTNNSAVQATNGATILSTVFTLDGDIKPNKFNVVVGKPYVLEVDAKEDGQGCMSTIMIPGIYKNPLLITKGKIRLPFTINSPGTYQITCAMGVPRGTITAVRA